MIAIGGSSEYRSEFAVLINSHSLLYISQSWEDISTFMWKSCDLTKPLMTTLAQNNSTTSLCDATEA